MPTFNIFVTTKREDIPDGFLLRASKFIAGILGKPESVRFFYLVASHANVLKRKFRERFISIQIFRRWKKLFIISYLLLWLFSFFIIKAFHFQISGKLLKRKCEVFNEGQNLQKSPSLMSKLKEFFCKFWNLYLICSRWNMGITSLSSVRLSQNLFRLLLRIIWLQYTFSKLKKSLKHPYCQVAHLCHLFVHPSVCPAVSKLVSTTSKKLLVWFCSNFTGMIDIKSTCA